MKLTDIKPLDITQEFMEAFDRIMEYKSLGSFQDKDSKIFIYSITNTEPLIKIQIKIKKIASRVIGELSFFTEELGFEQLNISSSGKAISIIATVADLGKKFIPQLDILFCTCKLIVPIDDTEENWKKAKKEVKSKSFIYGKLAARFTKENDLSYQSFFAKVDYGYVLIKSGEISKSDIIKYYGEWAS